MTQMPTLSRRGATAPASPIRRLNPYAVAARARGITVHHLNIGQPDLPTSSQMRKAYRDFDAEVLAYSPSHGTPTMRAAWADYYNRNALVGEAPEITPAQVLVTVGGSEALLFALATICDPGDNVVVAEPYYTNYRGFAHLLGIDVVAVPTHVEDDFALPPERVAAACNARTRALVLTSPGNPTGAVLRAEQLAALGQVCVERGLFLISDEVYREFVYDDLQIAPSALAHPELAAHVVVTDSVSKRYSACGARVGCLVTRNAELYASALCFAQARLSPPTVDQFAAEAALRTPAAETRAVVEEYRRRRDAAVAGLRSIPGVSCSVPAGAFYLIADLPVRDASDFCMFLLRDFDLAGETVMLAPAEGFYATPGAGRNQVRVACVLKVPVLRRCIEILRAALPAFAARG